MTSDRSGALASIVCSSVFVSLLAVAFIVLKLTDYIDWSWWWVLSPIWITMVLSVVIFLIALAIFLVLDR